MTNFIAFTDEGNICGVGSTREESLIDAYGVGRSPKNLQDPDPCFSTAEATVELVVEVFRCGGGEVVNWDIKDDGVADLEENRNGQRKIHRD